MNVHSVTGSTIRRFMVRPREGDKRARILDAAVQVFSQKGFYRVSDVAMSPASRVARSTYTLRAKMTCSSPWRSDGKVSRTCMLAPKRISCAATSSVSISAGRSDGVGRYSHRHCDNRRNLFAVSARILRYSCCEDILNQDSFRPISD